MGNISQSQMLKLARKLPVKLALENQSIYNRAIALHAVHVDAHPARKTSKKLYYGGRQTFTPWSIYHNKENI